MTVSRSFFLILSLVLSHLARAEFIELPKVPDFSELQTYEEAMHRLFQGRSEEFVKINTAEGQLHQAYTAFFDGALRFVKIVREDCDGCDQIRFEYEWLLKKNLPRYRWLTGVNAQLVLPDRAASFILNHKQHYILSYPLIEGATLKDIYEREYLDPLGVLNIKQESLLRKAFYRYGQVLALAHLDPKQPAKNRAEMLSRVVRLHLPDRNGTNEIYNSESDRIFLLDLASEVEDFDGVVQVGQDLQDWLQSLAEMAFDAHTEDGFHCGLAHDCIINPLKQFALGYASSLPLYKRSLVMSVIGATMVDYLQEQCLGEKQGDSFCPAVEIIERQFLRYRD
ncbi:hypothetical protein [Endozoicomonas sp. 4G]|uniref:hypothetical protein n=1 Tax=Endozoicomonas sp. 4G TaxID=2872754 RepID=UPI0020791761|nr:hypothetical protein [Endozoicomonas sp. 4G]